MSHGINIYNASNNIIINQDYTNYHVVSTGTVTNGGIWPALSLDEIIYIRLSVNGASLITNSNGDFAQNPVPILITSGAVMEYVIVKRTPAVSASTFGFRIYQSDGVSIAFDSGRIPVKIVSSLTRVPAAGTGNLYNYPTVTINQPFSVSSGRKRYISGQPFRDMATVVLVGNDLPLIPEPGYETLTWNSDMQQVITPAQITRSRDLQSTKVWLTIDT
jgi:hypothetical protein